MIFYSEKEKNIIVIINFKNNEVYSYFCSKCVMWDENGVSHLCNDQIFSKLYEFIGFL